MPFDPFEFVRRQARHVRLARYRRELERAGGSKEQLDAVTKEIDDLEQQDNRPKTT